MNGTIWCTTFQEGKEKLEEIIEDYLHYGITVQSRKISMAVFKNGDCWRISMPDDTSRGYRCNVAYIQRSIPYEIYQTVISPCLFNFPFSAIHLWGEGNLHISDKP